MKTAVEWLFNQLSINNMTLDKGTKAHQEMEQKILKKAKEMEKEQIIDAYETSHISMMTAQQYCKETFNK
jgi:hypothetical protein